MMGMVGGMRYSSLRSLAPALRAVVVATLVLGCNNTSGGGGNGQTGVDGGTTTAGPGDATTPPLGDGSGTGGTDGGVLPTPEKCTSADDCDAAKPICDCIGRCVPAGIAEIPSCTADKNCGSENYCDVCAAVCRPLKTLCEPCEAAGECQDDGACIDFQAGGRFCLRACVADPGCPQPGFRCEQVAGQSQKQCVPLSGVCSQPTLCGGDVDCEFGAICSDTAGKCVPGCPSDDVCPTGQVCSAFRCSPACSDESPCPEGQECDDKGHCKLPGGCLEPADCLEPETYCDPQENLCKEGCLQDFDCKSSAKECLAGSCADKGCTANYYCAFGEVCELETGTCKMAEGPYCEPGCDPQSEASCGGEPNLCLSLQDDEGNELGDFCFVACGPDPANACPQGYACQELEHPEKGVFHLCFRDCTYDPL